MIDGRQYLVIAAGGGGKNGTPSGDSFVAFALPQPEQAPVAPLADGEEWIELFDGESLDGWVHMNGSHTYCVEDGAIVGRTTAGSDNSFLCTTRTFADFELEVEVWIDGVTNSGIQFRSRARPITTQPGHGHFAAGRVYGPQAEIRRREQPGLPTTGTLYGEALGTGWLSSEEKIEQGHDFYNNEAWNHLRIVAVGPRLQTWVNDHPVEDLVREDVFETHPSGFIGLQVHGIEDQGPFEMKFRKIRIRPLPVDH